MSQLQVPSPNLQLLLLSMRIKTLLTLLLATTLLVSSSFSNCESQDEGPTPLQLAMSKMHDSKKEIRRLIADPVANKAALLGACAGIQEGTLAGISHPPKPPEEADEHEWRIGFQRTMLSVLDVGLACELAVRNGDAEGAAAAFKKMVDHENNGHNFYMR